MKEKNQIIKEIKNFSKISISKICKKLYVNRSNVLNGTASLDTILAVRNELNKEIEEWRKKDVGR